MRHSHIEKYLAWNVHCFLKFHVIEARKQGIGFEKHSKIDNQELITD